MGAVVGGEGKAVLQTSPQRGVGLDIVEVGGDCSSEEWAGTERGGHRARGDGDGHWSLGPPLFVSLKLTGGALAHER